MDINIGIDSKPRIRRGRRRFSDRLVTLARDRSDDISDSTGDSNITLNLRVKERENSGIRKSPLGNIFKDTSTTAIKGLFCKESSHDLKDTIKRPLTGLFRRPTYRSNSKFGSKSENKAETNIASEASNCRNENVISQSLEAPCLEGVLHDVANAPVININQVSTVCQFEFMNAKNVSLAKLDDTDLSLLSRFLCLEEEANDEKVSWTWDYLFGSVSTEMRDEWTQDEECDDGDYKVEN